MKGINKILCLCLASVSTIVFSACKVLVPPSVDATPPTSTSENVPPSLSTGVSINSLDKWNYYAAKKTIEDRYGKPYTLTKTGTTNAVKSMEEYGYGYATSDGEIIEGERPDELPDLSQNDNTIVYYDLYSWQQLTIHRTVYFQMELMDGNGFLGKRLGAGTVEVAVALGDRFEDLSMITFRNGEKFYSCMYHGDRGNGENGRETYYFAAYRYIEGFYYVKNLQWEHYLFSVELGEGDIVFTCDYTYTGEENETPVVKENSTYYVNETVTYTIEELEAYFNAEEAPVTNDETSDDTF